ncbi:MAG: phosphotransferase [Colwellia sp.]|nr:phosphotransferase [Colwellia sp.]
MLQESRHLQFVHWLLSVFSSETDSFIDDLTSMTGDAGFRQYFRFQYKGQSLIAVDAPPLLSNNEAFVAIQKAFSSHSLLVPQIVACDLVNGFFCITDFGDKLLSDVVAGGAENTVVKEYYNKAIKLIPTIASTELAVTESYSLPIYDQEFIHRELTIFKEWLLEKHLQIELSAAEIKQLNLCFDFLTISAISQPQVTVHRDYHSRNIMVLNNNELGIIDFQDAVIGPITYDIVSLLRDCYVRYPDEMIKPLFKSFCQLAEEKYDLNKVTSQQWQQWFDLMGLQRHLKASGIFCRLYYRDNKNGYLKDIPLTLSYIEDISAIYPQLSFLNQLMTKKVQPLMKVLISQSSSVSEA